MFDVFHGDEIKAYTSGYALLGVESIEISNQSKAETKRILGSTSSAMTASDTSSQTMSMSRYLMQVDTTVLNCTGDVAFPMSIHCNGVVHEFLSGYLDQYTINCAIGAVPKVTTNFTIYDEIVKTTGSGQSGDYVYTEYFCQQGSIICTCDHISTNRVVGFDLSVSTSREPIYVIGKKKPISVVQNHGLEYSAAVQIDVDDAFLASGLTFLDNREDKTVSLVVKDKTNATNLVNISIPNASLVDQALSASADGGLKLTLNYKGYS